ncbi:OmpW/AlkL family protein [Asticcacaulis sp. 201]|uniref:OmpW/AlkL family protein n=1 Tax=Asticcacaulis sp. 201 TaxID=3028787 RepID=UPI002915D7C6|nr:OmpW family outer membrane protein [Asticcacaulis sp. 201]MDV6333051.1 OmpW family outer membrane protein [Asticcacaulis sp. 201]
MTHTYKTMVILGSLAALGLAGAGHAQEAFVPKHAGQFVIVGRATVVAPSEKGDILTAAGVDSGLNVAVGNSTVPTLGFSYFFTDHIAVEGILGTSKHKISAVGPSTNVEVHDTWVLPPVVTLQYHFNPAGKVSPYVGAGVNLMDWYGGKDKNGFKVRLKNGAGTAVQAGVDVALKGHWALNVDYKKVFYKTDARINDGALKSKVTLDPAVTSIGLAYRF